LTCAKVSWKAASTLSPPSVALIQALVTGATAACHFAVSLG
jgi:hypothetical protein